MYYSENDIDQMDDFLANVDIDFELENNNNNIKFLNLYKENLKGTQFSQVTE